MNKVIMATMLAGSLSLSACATNRDPYYGDNGNRSQAGSAARGGAIGAGVGAVAGALIPGVSVVTGAIAGGVAGAVLGAVRNGRQYYRDTQGACYYVDQNNRPIYDNNVRC